MGTKPRWQDAIGVLLGLWLFAMPLRSHVPMSGLCTWDDFLFGALIIALSLLALFRPWAREERINLLVGLWLIAAPFVLGFVTHHESMWSDVGTGTVIVADVL